MLGLVSVIIPNFNNATYLSECLDSCLKQGELLKEVIIVDDHSSDNSREILTEYQTLYPEKIFWFSNPKKGANDARNFGFAKSTGSIIQWLDSDDCILPGKFATQVPVLESKEADIVYSDWLITFFRDGEKIKEEHKVGNSYDDYLFELIRNNWTCSHNYLVNRGIAEKLSDGVGWNPRTKVGQDREYFTTAGILGAKFHYVPGTFAVYNKQASGTISGMDFRQRLEENQALEANLRTAILKSNFLSKDEERKYLSILDTDKLKACFYHPRIGLSHTINPLTIAWDHMHWKMRLIMPWIWIKMHLVYWLRR